MRREERQPEPSWRCFRCRENRLSSTSGQSAFPQVDAGGLQLHVGEADGGAGEEAGLLRGHGGGILYGPLKLTAGSSTPCGMGGGRREPGSRAEWRAESARGRRHLDAAEPDGAPPGSPAG